MSDNNSMDCFGSSQNEDNSIASVSFLNSSVDIAKGKKKGQGRKPNKLQSEENSPLHNTKNENATTKRQQRFLNKTKHQTNQLHKKKQDDDTNSSIQGQKIPNKRKAQNRIDELEKQTLKKVQGGSISQQQQVNQQFQQTNTNVVNPQVKAVFLYSPGERYPDLSQYNQELIEIRISTEYITKYNKYVIDRALCGNDTYTSDSDAVCMLVHQGFIHPSFKNPNIDKYEAVSLICRITKNRKNYGKFSKNGFTSRANKNYTGWSIKPDSFNWLPKLGTQEQIQEYSKKMATWQVSKRKKSTQQYPNPKHLQIIPELNIIFNLNNEPAYKYSYMNICDKGNQVQYWVSFKLKAEVLYIDNEKNERYEISRLDHNHQRKSESREKEEMDDVFKQMAVYRIAKVKDPYECDNNFMSFSNKLPFARYDQDRVEILFDELDWGEFQWGSTTLSIQNITIEGLKSFKWYNYSNLKV